MTDFDILTVKDVALRLRLAERTVYAMVQDQEIPAFRIRNQWRFRRDTFEAWLAAVSAGEASPKDAAARAAAILPAPPESTAAPAPTSQGALALAEFPGMLVRAAPAGLSPLTERISQGEIHRRFVDALGSAVRSHGPLDVKPLELDLAPPLPASVRVYLFNATRPPGGRPTGEHKIQIIVPGQKRGERGSFDDSGNRTVVLGGYVAEEDVFVLWDAGLYSDFAWSRNVQVKVDTIIKASAGRVARQMRQLRRPNGDTVLEEVLAVPPSKLVEALEIRRTLTQRRLLQEE